MFEPIIIIDPMTTIIIRNIFNFTMSFIEGLIVAYFALKYFKITKSKYIYIIWAFIYSFTATITNQYNIINLPFSLLAIIYIYVLLSTSNQQADNYHKLFIAILIQLIVSICNNASLFRAFFVLQPHVHQGIDYTQYSVIVSNDIIYYLFYLFSNVLIYFILKKLLAKNFTNNKFITHRYWTGFSILSVVIMIINSYTLESIYFGTFNQDYLYLIMISYLATILIIFYLFATLQHTAKKQLQKDNEIMQLKLIQTQYLELKNQKERNDKIKHDLEYFLDLVNHHQDPQKIKEVLVETIKEIDNQEIKLYSHNQIINSLLSQIKNIGKETNHQILFEINLDDSEISLSDYQTVIELTKDICHNSIGSEINVNIKRINDYCIFEYIFVTQDNYSFQNTNNLLTFQKIDDHELVKILLPTVKKENTNENNNH